MRRSLLALALLSAVWARAGELQQPDGPLTLLDSDVFELSVGDSIGKQEILHTAAQLDRFPCSRQELASLEKILADPEFTLAQILRRARAMNGGPIRIKVSNRPKVSGLFKRTRTLGEFDNDTGAINLYCHEEPSGHVTMSGSGDQAETLSHELGHMVMYHAYKKDLPGHDGHSKPFELSSPGGAWNEGFAAFFALGLHASNTRGSCIFHMHCLDDVVKQLQGEDGSAMTLSVMKEECRNKWSACPDGKLPPYYAERQEWRDRPWEEKIRNEDFVFGFLGELAAAPAAGGALAVDLAKMDRLLAPLGKGRHEDFAAYLRHYVTLYPGEKARVKETARRLLGDAPLPDFLR